MDTPHQHADFILGTLIGDALGLPAHKRTHNFIRMYFKGIKGYTGEYEGTMSGTGLRIGQNSQNPLPLLDSVNLSSPVLMAEWTARFFAVDRIEGELIVKFFQALGGAAPESPLDATALLESLYPNGAEEMIEALSLFPGDMIYRFNEAMTEPDAVKFAVAMTLRAPHDFETLVLSTINMGGLTALTGAITGGAATLLLGRKAIPEPFMTGLEHSAQILERLGRIK